MNKRNQCLDVVRGVCIILMVIGHVGFGDKIDHYMHGFHMPVFFIISGFYFKANSNTGRYLSKKMRSCLVPYFLFGFVGVLISYIVIDDYDVIKSLKSLLLFNTNGNMPIVGALWFLMAFFFAGIVYNSIYSFNTFARWSIVFLVALSFYVINEGLHFRTIWAIDTAMIALPFLEGGRLMKDAQLESKLNHFLSKKSSLIILLIASLMNAILIFINSYVNMRSAHYGQIILFYTNAIIAFIILWCVAILLDRCPISFVSHILNSIAGIGENSLHWLCLNQLIIFFLRYVWLREQFIDRISILILSVIIMKIFDWLTERYPLLDVALFGKRIRSGK